VLTFAELTGDYNPLHLDEEFARQSAFGKPVVYGMLSASFISTMIGMLVPGKGALWTSQTLEFLKPAFVGDTLKVTAKVKQKSVGTRTLILDVTVANQHGQNLIVGQSSVRLLKLEEKNMSQNPKEKRTYIITGGSRGIGAGAALWLAAKGHSVVVNYSSSEREALELVTRARELGGNALAMKADVTKLEDVDALISAATKEFGAVDGFVHCAAPTPIPQAFQETSWEVFQSQFDVQLKGAYNCVQRVLPHMIENKSGCMVFVGSIYSDGAPPPQLTPYVCAKSALSAMARSLAVEYGPKGIRFNVVSPGMTQTQMIANTPDKAKMLAKMQTPLRRLADPQDIAGAIEFLLSDNSNHITGETLRVCGGVVMI
jgi:3-oxoacyl-[acyl-carrier protein] reductase